MHGLKMPDALAGLRLYADERFGEEVVTQAMSAVPVACRPAGLQIDVPQSLVAAHQRPDVSVAGVLPRLVLPGLIAELARLGHGVEYPERLAGADVESLDVAARLLLDYRPVVDRRADDYRVAANYWRRCHRVIPRIDGERNRLGQIHFSAFAEFRDRLAGLCVNRPQVGVGGRDVHALLFAVRPVRDAAMHEAEIRRSSGFVSFGVEGPDRLARPGVDRRHLRERSARVEPAADHQRSRLLSERREHPVLFLQRQIGRIPHPRDLQFACVLFVYLVERRIFGRAAVASVITPLAFSGPVLGRLLRAVLGRDWNCEQGDDQADNEQRISRETSHAESPFHSGSVSDMELMIQPYHHRRRRGERRALAEKTRGSGKEGGEKNTLSLLLSLRTLGVLRACGGGWTFAY